MNTITYKELKNRYLNDDTAKANVNIYFTGKNEQPSIHRTGFYSAPSWNWAYLIGIVTVQTTMDGEPIEKTFEVVTQFGQVKAARLIHIPKVVA